MNGTETYLNYDYQLYKNQINLKKFGLYGQNILAKKKFACIGSGGLGNPLSVYLMSAGAMHLAFIDGDEVEKSNLQRQFLYQKEDIGKKKVEVAKNNLLQINKNAHIEIYSEHINKKI